MVTSGEEKKKILTRLRRIEGQTRGIQRMVEEDKYCVDIMRSWMSSNITHGRNSWRKSKATVGKEREQQCPSS